MIIPETYDDLVIYKGVDFSQDVVLSGVDLTGCTVKCQVRDKQQQAGTLIVEMVVTVPDPLTGHINLFIEKANTITLTKKSGFYSLVVTNTGSLDSVYLMGSITITGTATVI